MDLHGQIMDIQVGDIRKIMKLYVAPINETVWDMVETAYKIGHRDARHAAAELVSQDDIGPRFSNRSLNLTDVDDYLEREAGRA